MRNLRVNESNIIGENTLNGDHFATEGNYDTNNTGKTLFWVFS